MLEQDFQLHLQLKMKNNTNQKNIYSDLLLHCIKKIEIKLIHLVIYVDLLKKIILEKTYYLLTYPMRAAKNIKQKLFHPKQILLPVFLLQ